jgi:hypothetical protein
MLQMAQPDPAIWRRIELPVAKVFALLEEEKESKCHCVGGEFSPCLLLHVLFLLYFFFVLHGHRQMKQCQPA